MAKETERKEHFLETSWGFFIVIMAIALIYFGGGSFMWDHYFRKSPTNAGTFGDMFGGITSFFSALTVVLVFYAARLQKRELHDTREEMKSQTQISLALSEASKKQSEASIRQSETASKQNKNLVLQRFENTLFNLISIYLQTVDSFVGNNQKNGKAVFPDEWTHYFAPKFTNQFGHTLNYLKEDYGSFIEKYNSPRSIGEIDKYSHYYKHLINILVFIKDATLSETRRKFYLNTFVSLLSSHELTLLYFYIAFDKGINSSHERKDVQAFCKHYRIFEQVTNLPNDTYKNIPDSWPQYKRQLTKSRS